MTKKAPVKRLAWRIEEWAEIIGCKRSTVYNWVAQGKIKSVKLGYMRVIVTDPAAWLERHMPL